MSKALRPWRLVNLRRFFLLALGGIVATAMYVGVTICGPLTKGYDSFTPAEQAVTVGGGAPGHNKAKVDQRSRYVEASAGFSFVPPQGWRTRPIPGAKYLGWNEPAGAAGTSNIAIADDTYNGSLDDYSNSVLAGLQEEFTSCELIRRDDCITSEGLAGKRIIVEVQKNGGLLIRQSYYFFHKGDTVFVVICSTGADRAQVLEPVFEACINSFRFDKK